MGQFILKDEAVAHIKNICDYTRKRWGSQQVKRYLGALQLSLNQLAEDPLVGTLRSKDEGVYSFPSSSNTVYYTIRKDDIVILAVLHRSMTPELHLGR